MVFLRFRVQALWIYSEKFSTTGFGDVTFLFFCCASAAARTQEAFETASPPNPKTVSTPASVKPLLYRHCFGFVVEPGRWASMGFSRIRNFRLGFLKVAQSLNWQPRLATLNPKPYTPFDLPQCLLHRLVDNQRLDLDDSRLRLYGMLKRPSQYEL